MAFTDSLPLLMANKVMSCSCSSSPPPPPSFSSFLVVVLLLVLYVHWHLSNHVYWQWMRYRYRTQSTNALSTNNYAVHYCVFAVCFRSTVSSTRKSSPVFCRYREKPLRSYGLLAVFAGTRVAHHVLRVETRRSVCALCVEVNIRAAASAWTRCSRRHTSV